jgi:hypothetical protein
MNYENYKIETAKVRIDLLRDESLYTSHRIEMLSEKRKNINEEIKILKLFINEYEMAKDE